MIKLISQIHNYIQLGLWGWIFVQLLVQSFTNNNDSACISTLVKIAQTEQGLDLIFTLIGVNKGSILSNILQLGGRLLVAWLFITPTVCFCSLRNAVIAWSLAEIIRYNYYIFKDNQLLKFLRYKAFYVLYPFGITGELRLVNRYIETEQGAEYYTLLRGLQAILIVGGLFMIMQMHSSSQKVFKKVKTEAKASSPTSSKHKRE